MFSWCGAAALQGCSVQSFGILTLPVGHVLLQKPQSWSSQRCHRFLPPKKDKP